jgi:fused signal recognition particle receptor
MFGFLKEKLSKVVKKISDRVEKEEPVEEKKVEEIKPELQEKEETKLEEKKEIKKGIIKKAFEKVTKKVVEKEISDKDLEDILDDLGINLLEADVAFEVSEKIKEDLKKNLVGKQVKRGQVKNIIIDTFKTSLSEILNVGKIDLNNLVKSKKPLLMLFLGFNGSGKTTSLAKVASYLKKEGFSCVFAAGDSFRAASIEQLEEHGRRLGVDVIKHKYGADPAAVIFDAKEHAKSRGIDVVLADTAGRSHVNKNLMDELKKITRVDKPDLKIFVIDSLVGNDAVPQAKMFDEAVGIDAVMFTKVDVNEKGGSILSVSYILKKPILFIGVGQSYSSIKAFKPEEFIENII